MPARILRRTAAVAAFVFIGAALLVLSGLLPVAVSDTVYLLLPATWLTACCALAGLALRRADPPAATARLTSGGRAP
ncbi:hypothetical protein [Actinoplanes teichomyceticus]|uniref:Uncharacterized protein n=1 Tax=Actinoplanes teichomyceticus TaxID=1867 RepID=A0A561WQW3_ACTTI|nr:hypothetical protein [Actinoplanes teichomyceticus]TWG26266.1 hypothetical protein FHX34_1011247 [Actinoplanes teichomyceticus]GIF11345.1 hypothetical protein Ate01nite_13770 [Actinoplanes teichomyceticus]